MGGECTYTLCSLLSLGSGRNTETPRNIFVFIIYVNGNYFTQFVLLNNRRGFWMNFLQSQTPHHCFARSHLYLYEAQHNGICR